MAVWIYPQNYELPAEPEEVVLNAAQRDQVKEGMQTYLNNQAKPVLIKELIEVAQDYIMTNYSIHIRDDVLGLIALEIRDEYGVPEGQEPV
jgi:hypothetical protein